MSNQQLPCPDDIIRALKEATIDVLNEMKQDRRKNYYSNNIEMTYYERFFNPISNEEKNENNKITMIAEEIANYAWELYHKYNTVVSSNKKNKYVSFNDFLNKHFAETPELKTSSKNYLENSDPIKNYVDYLVKPQLYSVSTVNAGVGTNFLWQSFVTPYRHAYIKIYDSPFTKKNEERIVELNPHGQTNEMEGQKLYSQTVVTPGMTVLALDIAGRQLLKTHQYDPKNYRPWSNDCQTFIEHTQAQMNLLLPPSLQQDIKKHFRFSPNISEKDLSSFSSKNENSNLKPKVVMTEHGPDYKFTNNDNSETIGEGLAGNFRNDRSRSQTLEERKEHATKSSLATSFFISAKDIKGRVVDGRKGHYALNQLKPNIEKMEIEEKKLKVKEKSNSKKKK